MPRQRQRVVFCDCYDCVDRPAQASLSEDGLKAAVAVARQEPPPKGLLVVASGFLRYEDKQVNLDACTLPHLNHLVNEGNLGFLSSRQGCTGKNNIFPQGFWALGASSRALRKESKSVQIDHHALTWRTNYFAMRLQGPQAFMTYRNYWK